MKSFRFCRSRKDVLSILAFLLFVSLSPKAISNDSVARNGGSDQSYVVHQIAKIKAEPSSVSRTQQAEELANWVNGRNLVVLTERDIDGLADMLNDNDDSVRFWIAIALGHIGPRAAVAIPLLQKTLENVSCTRVNGVAPEFTSAQAIRFAFKKIGRHPKDIICK